MSGHAGDTVAIRVFVSSNLTSDSVALVTNRPENSLLCGGNGIRG